MSNSNLTEREQLRDKLEKVFLEFRNSLCSNYDDATLSEKGVDSCKFDLVEATPHGGMYFRPMSQEHLDTLIKRLAMYRIPFWPDRGRPPEADSYMVHDAINDQLRCSKDEEDVWKAYESTSWEPVG
jgi:hypothetical protein